LVEKFNTVYHLGLLVVSLLVLSSCQASTVEKKAPSNSQVSAHTRLSSEHDATGETTRPAVDPDARVLDLGSLMSMDKLVARIADRQVVFVGETHDRYDHHLNQLAIIRGLAARHPDLVIGMEFFQQPFQAHLDQFIAGEIDDKELLRKTEYFDRWRYDYRLYRPILEFARSKGIPVIALNLPAEITDKVAREGLASLSDSERAQIPAELDRSDKVYEQRLRAIFARHPPAKGRQFDRFLDVQLLWDEGMAERVASHFREHPEGHMVVLAGSGHLMYGAGIPRRVKQRVPVETAIVINGGDSGLEPGMADYLLLPEKQDLPRSGLLGILLDTDDTGVHVKAFSDDSPAEKAGLKKGDRILRIADESVSSYPGVRLALQDRKPGEKVRVKVARKRLLRSEEQLLYDVTLY
jgi:uncharacterized iron-regulated protein